MQFTDEQVKEILERIEVELGKRRIKKYAFYEGSQVSSALYSNWNTGKAKPTRQMLGRIADYLGVSLEFLINGTEEDDDIDDLRQVMRERPEVAFLMKLAKDGRTSDILEASALLQRYKEESENK